MRVDGAEPHFVTAPRADADAAASAARPGRAAPAVGGVVVDIGVPTAPPLEVLEQAHQAAHIAARMALDNRELHFHKDEDSGRIVVQVRDLRGAVIRTIPPSSALDLLTLSGGA